jgi:hypothetical protein
MCGRLNAQVESGEGVDLEKAVVCLLERTRRLVLMLVRMNGEFIFNLE